MKTFEEWFAELEAVAKANGEDKLHAADAECWREYFNDEYSPEEAYREDLSYANG